MNRFKHSALLLASAFLFTLTACTSMKVKMGWKVYLDRTPVASMQATLPKGPAIAPGQKSPLVVTFQQPDGKTLTTEGAGGGKVMWKELSVTATVVTVNQKGVLALPKDPRKSDGKEGHIVVTAPSHPDLRAELDIPVRYNLAFVANFSGASGSNGLDGSSGTDGISGSPGSADPDNPSAGGDGGDGSDGGDAGNGGDGGNAPPVIVRIALRAGTPALLQASVAAAGKTKYYLIDPQGGSLTVRADGGAGGSAGKGGRGGRGGSGGIGSPSGSSGHDGSDGHDGMSGSDGRGGLITVTYDPQVKPYLGSIRTSSQNGPKAIFQEAPVPALW